MLLYDMHYSTRSELNRGRLRDTFRTGGMTARARARRKYPPGLSECAGISP